MGVSIRLRASRSVGGELREVGSVDGALLEAESGDGLDGGGSRRR
jgi:hypothetical protein